MISKKEYLQALSVVQDYHAQIYKEVDAVLNKKDRVDNSLVEIRKFIINADISIRLGNALHNYRHEYPNALIGDVTREKLLRLRNVGIVTANEFEREKNQYFKIYE